MVDSLTRELEQSRARLRAMAYRMLGSVSDADDALQEVWLRTRRTSEDAVHNPGGWLTTALAHTCLDLLRSRSARHEVPIGVRLPDPIVTADGHATPETQALLTDSIGLALQVVLDHLDPAERVAFVLHDSFAVPFGEIAAILDRSPEAARQLASRARRRIRSVPAPEGSPEDQRRVVDAFFAAARRGDLAALVRVLAPDVVLRGDLGAGKLWESTGSDDAAAQAVRFAHPRAVLRPILVNGAAGALVTVDDRAASLMAFTVTGGRIAEIDVLADPHRIAALLPDG
ncbi:sigma-70 family RNA polymerase sigma factor [Nocardia sp. CA2R105]|uniref:sigma-70 family RNA polymerase sigma factor n=1 Tax=Nocardia coffeae TaxID=2873381 RepID=UPI001CA6B25E|nr:sigma-70 family RNA polymerase sigma factor [Nocardia coffeae]MBY8860720.1 sigma-70 family RNA polymerase sigma factor [Nocardia coffeae]